MALPLTKPCPCGTNKALLRCCYPILIDHKQASTALELMRSRYTAYSLKLTKHIKRTMRGINNSSSQSIKEFAHNNEFLSLTIIKTENGLNEDSTGIVKFEATLKSNNKISILHGKSFFEKIHNKWFYTKELQD